VTLTVSAPALGATAAINDNFPDDQVLLNLPDPAATTRTDLTDPDQLANQIQGYLQLARSKGDPRYLGYAQSLLQSWPETNMNARLLVLRATLRQSLHQFDEARQDLNRVLSNSETSNNLVQALLTLANLDVVQGRYPQAEQTCDRLQNDYPGLISASCTAQVRARTGEPETAYESLKTRLENTRKPDAGARSWTEGTLADIAAQSGRAEAEKHWLAVLALTPEDLYSRTQFADWLIQKQRYDQAIALTEGYEAVDSLAVLRVIALQQRDPARAQHLIAELEERFSEARWRGNLLHQRDYARFLLDVQKRPGQALTYALDNWASQREPMDTRLLLRTATASGDDEALATATDWLAATNQNDARYPETQP
jgi:tetratricopeptide (TPR) repeat protein